MAALHWLREHYVIAAVAIYIVHVRVLSQTGLQWST